MFRNYLLSALRQIRKHGLFFIINVSGFSVGIATVVTIFLYINYELSFDKGMEHYENLYRVCWETTLSGVDKKVPASPPPLCETFIKEFPEVIDGVRLYKNNEVVLIFDDEVFKERNFYFADSNFFELFSIPLIIGDEQSILRKPNTVVLTESTAKRLFGEETPIGKLISFEEIVNFEVVGICADIPENYHLDIDFVASMISHPRHNVPYWQSNPYQTYLLLKEDAQVDDLKAKIPDLVEVHMNAFIQQVMNMSFNEFIEGGSNYNYTLQAVKDIHLRSDMIDDIAKRSNIRNIYIFMIIGTLILSLAIINYVNLSTAKGIERKQEIGARKIVGARKNQIIKQFLGESFFITLISTVLGMMLVESILPFINALLGESLSISYFDNFIVFPSLLGFIVVLSVLSGLYPAFVLSSYSPLTVFRKEGSSKKVGLRSFLIIFQYCISFLLIIATIVVFEQLNYLRDQDLGFDQEHVIVIDNANALGESLYTFKEVLNNEPFVEKVSVSSAIPGDGAFKSFLYRDGDSEDDIVAPLIFPVDHDFISCYDLKITQGRNFDMNLRGDSMAFIINQKGVDVFGLEDPLSEAYYNSGTAHMGSWKIIGVVEDFNFNSLHDEIQPCLIAVASTHDRFVSVKVKTNDLRQAIDKLQSKWEEFNSRRPFDYFFIDQYFDAMYKKEELMRKIFTIFSAISIFIASIGLFGIMLFMTQQRTKEIGIRKTLGASRNVIFKLFINQYIKWIGISVVIGAPIAWWATKSWLQQFAYRINFHFGFLLVAFILLLIVTFITVYSRVMHVARQNPVKALRYE